MNLKMKYMTWIPQKQPTIVQLDELLPDVERQVSLICPEHRSPSDLYSASNIPAI